MANMSLKKNPMPSQEPDVRNKNFDEVALGYTEEMAIDEAKRCLNCKNPKCVNGCPVNVHIPEFIAKVAEGKFDEASASSPPPTACPPSAAVSAPRRTSARASASGASRVSPWASAVWSGLWRTITMPTAIRAALPPCRRATATR